MIRALIIEDNPGARAELRELLSHHSQIAVVGEAPSVGRARTLLARDDYDLVFLDIELRGGNGFDLVPLVRPEASVIFVTAYDQHAIRAFEVNALDYLLKPVEPTRLAASLERLDQTVPASTEPLEQQDLVHLQTDDGARFISANTISAIRADQNYTHVHLQDGTHHHLRRTLKSWEDQLCPAVLLRAARDALINPRHIRQAETLAPGRGGLLDLSGCPEKIPATNRHWASLQAAVRRGT